MWSARMFCIASTFFAYSCEDTRNELSEAEAQKWVNKELMEQVKVTYSDSGRLQLEIVGPKMIRHLESGNTQEEFTDGFFTKFYDADERLVNTLASKYALRKETDGKTIMRDSVVFSSLKEEVLKTSELIWDERNGKLFTDKFVRVIRKDEIIQGFGFETDQSFKKGSLKSVDGQIPSEKLLGPEEK